MAIRELEPIKKGGKRKSEIRVGPQFSIWQVFGGADWRLAAEFVYF
jgi:hypothetical protein